MANDATGNPMYIDSTGTIFVGMMLVSQVRWANQPGAASQLVLTDTKGRVVFQGDAQNSALDQNTNLGDSVWWNGLKCTVITAGSYAQVYLS